MSDATPTATMPAPSSPESAPIPGLLSRAIGIITAPGAMYVHVVRSPKVAGMMFIVAVLQGLALGVPQFTDRGRAAALEMQVEMVENFGGTVTDEVYQQMEQRSRNSNLGAYSAIVTQLVGVPFGALVLTVILWGVFNTIMGGTATFKQVMAVLVHSQIISALGTVFSAPIMYARGVMQAGSVANLGAAFPMLDESSFAAKALGAVDLFLIWWVIVLSIGLATLFKRKAASIATGLFVVYGIVALAIAYFTAR
ncbi:MAG: YIP1 family protein [Acidobacteria bacterium]|nr:YIP1 family protein [Acidobacteriota bacterium]